MAGKTFHEPASAQFHSQSLPWDFSLFHQPKLQPAEIHHGISLPAFLSCAWKDCLFLPAC